MIELKVIVLDEGEYENHGCDYKTMMTATHIIVRKNDGTNICIKDRWNCGMLKDLCYIGIPRKS